MAEVRQRTRKNAFGICESLVLAVSKKSSEMVLLGELQSTKDLELSTSDWCHLMLAPDLRFEARPGARPSLLSQGTASQGLGPAPVEGKGSEAIHVCMPTNGVSCQMHINSGRFMNMWAYH